MKENEKENENENENEREEEEEKEETAESTKLTGDGHAQPMRRSDRAQTTSLPRCGTR